MRWLERRSLAPRLHEVSEQGRGAACRVESVVLEVTQSCNNNCAHCYNYWRKSDRQRSVQGELSGSEYCDLVRKILLEVPLKQVALSGGEPLLRADLPEIAFDISMMGLGVVVITNGTLLDRSRLKRFPAGCAFEVTLFSADAGIHDQMAGRIVFNKLINNLSRIETYGHAFILTCVITRLNAHDVTRTIKLGIALGAQAVLFNRINLSRRVFLRGKHFVPDASQLKASLREANEISAKYGIPVAVSVPIPPCVADPSEYPHLIFGWCPRGNSDSYYTISSNGYLRPCNHSSVVLGDLRTQGFTEIVTGHKALDFWASTTIECEECKHPLKDKCRGGCRAAADECYGTAERRDPFIELACV